MNLNFAAGWLDKKEDHEEQFAAARITFWSGIVFVGIFFVLLIWKWHEAWPDYFKILGKRNFGKNHPVIATAMTLAAGVGLTYIYVGLVRLKKVYFAFIEEVGISDAIATISKLSGDPQYVFHIANLLTIPIWPTLGSFKTFSSAQYRSRREKLLKMKHRKQQRLREAEASQSYEALKCHFEEIVVSASAEGIPISSYVNEFGASTSMEQRRTIISALQARLQKGDDTGPVVNQASKLARLRVMFNELAAEKACPEATALFNASNNASSPKQAIPLLTQAITLQKQANRSRQMEPEQAATQVTYSTAAVQEPLLVELLPPAIHRRMAIKILTELPLGSSLDRNGLRIRVAGSYRKTFRSSFPSQSFDETLLWLIGERILTTTGKGRDQQYALNTKPASCMSESSAKVVRSLLAEK